MKKNQQLTTLLLVAVMVLFGAVQSYAQGPISVSGTITDAKGPVAGVTVMVKGTQTGTVTDVKGNYKINVPNRDAVLAISFIGYKSQEITVGTQRNINVFLEEDAVLLDEVVAIGYGVQKKSHLTGSVAKLDGTALVDKPISDVTQALQGMIGGLAINSNTSEVGVAPEIRVRGLGSISASSEPLVVIDGHPTPGGLSMISGNDIQSIEVLKDAASAAIYGSLAANGVIMITTKSGSVDKPKYSAKVYSGFKYAYQLHDLLTGQETLDLLTLEESWGGPAVSTQARTTAWLEQNMGATNWQKLGLRDAASITNVQFSVSGGKKDAKYYASASYTKDQGVMLQNEVNKMNFRAKYDTKLSRIADFGVNISGTYTNGTRPVNNFIDFYRTPAFLPLYHNQFSTGLTGYTGFARGNHFNNIQSPTGTPDAEGNPTFEGSTSPFSTANNNPRSIMENTERGSEAFMGTGNFYLSFQITKDLSFRTSNGFVFKNSYDRTYSNRNAKQDNVDAEATYRNALYVDLLTENMLNYTKKIDRHDFSVMLNYSFRNIRNEYAYMRGTGFPTDYIHTLNAATNFVIPDTKTYEYPDDVIQSYLGRVTYSYNDRYLMSASIRLDRSSLFKGSNKNAFFPSVSLGWRVSEENFMKSLDWVSNLKVRASYGVTGNNRIPHTATINALSGANYILGAGNGTLAQGLANTNDTKGNPNLTWEQTDEYNLGADFGFLNNRISMSVDAYYSITRALLYKQSIQSFTGYSYAWNNIGKVRNKGIEITLDTYNVRNKNFEWSTSFNISMNRNRFLELGGEERVITLGERNENYISKVGEPVVQYYGFKVIGVWNTNEEIAGNPSRVGDKVGGLRVWDANGDGEINDDDRIALGNPYPKATYGMTNNFRFKNIDFSFLLQGVAGITVLNGDAFYTETHKWNTKYIMTRWVSPEHPGDGRTPYQKAGIEPVFTDYALQNASYLALRTATIGYSFSKKMLKKMQLQGLRVYASGNNLLYFWSDDYKGVDPESRYTSGPYESALIAGYQRGGFPITSTITFGLDVTF